MDDYFLKIQAEVIYIWNPHKPDFKLKLRRINMAVHLYRQNTTGKLKIKYKLLVRDN